jgi:hypothetical protein
MNTVAAITLPAQAKAQAGSTLPGFSDDLLASAILATRAASGALSEILVVADAFHARIAIRAPGTPWKEVGRGDLGSRTEAVLAAAATARQLAWLAVTPGQVDAVDFHQSSAVAGARPFSEKELKSWSQNAARVTTAGRTGEVSAATRFEVASLAAWRCQYDGCGEDLREHFAPRARGNYGYFAHIVASSVDGPRGDAIESPLLADDPANIMLMCDKCHRLIDRVDPSSHDATRLRAMRAASVAEVKRLLGTLAFPKVRMLVIGGNIEGQTFVFDPRAAEEALWVQSLRAADAQPSFFARNGGHLGAVNSDAYWLSLFALLPTDIARLKAVREGTAADAQSTLPLAVFPLHSMSMLILTGRLLGDSGPTHIFQFHRDQVGKTPGAQWAWPTGPRPAADKFKVIVRREPESGDDKAILFLHLTAQVPLSDLPPGLANGDAPALPTIEITVDERNHRVVSHPYDLELLGRAIDAALATLQDKWHVRTIHVVPIAPSTACFRLGQKLQARHHADVVIHERRPSTKPGKPGEFVETIEISSTKVTLLSTGASTSIA